MLARTVGAAMTVVIAACYSPPEPACGFVCGSGGACPADYSCGADNICHRKGTPSTLLCGPLPTDFNVVSANAVDSMSVVLVYDAVPASGEATAVTNYSIPGLTITSATSSGSGATIALVTSPQSAVTYTVTVSNVRRAGDLQPLSNASRTFAGRAPFDVASATAPDSHTVAITFDGPPDVAAADNASNYAISPNLAVTLGSAPTVTGNTVFVPTEAQSATTYMVFVANVSRASDGEALSTPSAMFVGRTPFDVASAATASVTSMTVTFDAAPDAASATTLGNYAVPGLTLSGTPSLVGNTVTLTTSAQFTSTYTVTASNVTRASDGEPLTGTTAMFTGSNHCTDSVLDGDETDADCGGPTCTTRCASGKICQLGTDCASGTCNGGPPGTCM